MSTALPAPETAPTESPATQGVDVAEGAPGADAPRSPEDGAPALPDATSLEDRLPEWFRSTKALPLLILPLGLILLVTGSMPLWHTDLWGHLAYGRLIVATGEIPDTEPFMPLARGVELVDTAWLSQVTGYEAFRRFGLPGLQFLAALCVTTAAGVLALLGYRKTGSVGWTMVGLAAYLWLNWKQLFNGIDTSVVIRPQMAGVAAFTITLAVVASRPSRWHWVIIPVTFALWANLHGSFLAGLLLLAVFALGRACDLLRRTDKFGAALRDWPFWRLVLLTELAAAAVLLNPYGLRIYADTWLFVRNPNLADLPEWDPMTLRMVQGQAAAGVALALLFLYRMTPRRVGTGETLALILFGGSMLWTSRMIVWWAPIAAYCLVLHAAAVRRTYQTATKAEPTTDEEGPLVPARRSLWTVVSLFLVWIFIAPTPFARTLLHQRNATARIQNTLGMQVKEQNGFGVSVTHVDSRGPAGIARIRPGDVITGIDGRDAASIANLDRVVLAFGRLERMGSVPLTVSREGTALEVTLTPDVARPVSSQTPVLAARHFAENPPGGQLFNTYEFGDYLIWSSQDERGRPRLATFVASHAHLVPPDVWRAYVDTIGGSSGWEATLDRYGVNAIVLDKPTRQPFIDRLNEEPGWERSFDDVNSAVFRRREPLR